MIMYHMRITRIFLYLTIVLTTGCEKSTENSGPYFGNGFHNGWADQNSIVIWTRLTQNPERNINGAKFIDISSRKADTLDVEGNKVKINKAQIPDGLTLNDMEGACPGSPGEVRLSYYPMTNVANKSELEWAKVDETKNYTIQWKLENLEPDTKYVVEITARKNNKSKKVSDIVKGSFRTPPQANTEKEVDFCVVTCHDFWRKDTTDGHKIYDAMLKLFPDFYVHTGDIEYYDKPQPYAMTEEMMRFKWDRIFALPLQRTFWTQTTSYFMKDDHDALKDDAWPGMRYGTVSWERGLEIFEQEQFPFHDKFYKTVRWGKDLQVWITEGRNYRSPNNIPDGPGKTIFGEEQKKWLFETLQKSDATFKIIINANPILGPDKAYKKDNYSNASFKYEADEIREFLNQFDNVYLCNGDRHWQYVTHWEGTNLWEFGCGAGSDEHSEGWSPNDIRPEHRFLRVKGGFLRVRVFRNNNIPEIAFEYYDVNGEVVHTESFHR